MILRAGRDEDAEGFIALISACWAEYPGCVMDVDGENPELRALAGHFAAEGGALWAAERDGAVVGMVGIRPCPEESEGAWEICRLYLAASGRGSGLAQRLLDAAEAHARAQGATRLILWTDTRFDRAHRFYEKQGYVRQGPIRALDDLSKSLEYRYAKPARGVAVERLDAAATASAERRLAEILAEAAGVDLAAARATVRRVATEVALGTRWLLAAWEEGALVGTVQVEPGVPPEGAHRAALAMLAMPPGARGEAVGRALLRQAEQAARQDGRDLMTFEALEGEPSVPLCRDLGWQEAGRIPGWARDAAGRGQDRILFWRSPG